MKKSVQKESGGDGVSLIRHSAIGAVLGMLVTVLAVFAFSVAMTTELLPVSMSDSFVLVSVIVGTTVSGIYCAKRQGRGVITAGLASAGAYVALVLLGTLMFMKKGDDPSLTLKVVLAAVAGGGFGGALKLRGKNKKSKLRKKYNK
jgi:putative membrane protein (TIGR04086 family)